MNALSEIIADAIRREGPIGVDRFWDLALFHPDHGTYTGRDPIGRGGDFVTAPEVSQMFGELIGAWVATVWERLGRPSPFVLAELGPGRGTLIADVLRTLLDVAPRCMRAAQVRLVEVSDRLAAVQQTRLERYDLPNRRLKSLGEAEPHPTILLANELFDAVAIRQFVFDGTDWRERRVGLGDDGTLRFVPGKTAGGLGAAVERAALGAPEPGATLELSPAREALAADIAGRLAAEGGAALMIDYGHVHTGYGDTLQAIRGHAYADVLAEPGLADVTSHVDFQRLALPFRAAGLKVSQVTTQADFLLRLGLLARAGSLGARLDEAGREGIRRDVQRLAGAGKGEMGELFKVLAAASVPLDLPPFRTEG